MLELDILQGCEWDRVSCIDRSDISTDVVESLEDIMATTRYGIQHKMKGHTFVIRQDDRTAGIILMGEGVPWSVDPSEVRDIPFYRIMNFVMDRRFRGSGLGGQAMELVIRRIYEEFGQRPILVGCQKDNKRALNFYRNHGFALTDGRDEDDLFLIRYPEI